MFYKDKVVFRDIAEKDLSMILKWRNSDKVRSNMYTDQIIKEEDHFNWYTKMKDNKEVLYKIFQYNSIDMGVVGLYKINHQNKNSLWAFYIGEESSVQGIGALLEFCFLDLVFSEQGFHKLSCEVFCFNEPVIKLHKKFGFKEGGLFKQHVWKNEKFEDVIYLSLFHNEWKEERDKLEQKLFRKK